MNALQRRNPEIASKTLGEDRAAGSLERMGSERLGTVKLTGLRTFGFHGVLASERATGQDFVVDLEIEFEMPCTDSVADTVDYGKLALVVGAVVAGEPVDLIETLASRIAAKVLEDDRIRRTTVTVHKPQAPIQTQFDDVAVTISRSNHV